MKRQVYNSGVFLAVALLLTAGTAPRAERALATSRPGDRREAALSTPWVEPANLAGISEDAPDLTECIAGPLSSTNEPGLWPPIPRAEAIDPLRLAGRWA